MLRLGARDFKTSFRVGQASVSGPRRELWALRKTAWLSRNQIVEVNRCIHRLIRLTSTTGRKGRLYAITVLLTPLDRQS